MEKKTKIILLVNILAIAFAALIIGGSFNPGDERPIGYEFLDNNTVVHIWNNATISDYFFDKESGIQFTNHYEDYWSRNVFCVGYYAGDSWNKIKCADELSNFNRDIQTDNLTYVNATLWKDFVYGSYNFRLGIQYHLGLNDTELSITIYGKNIGIDLPYDLGFAWKVTDVEIPPAGNDEIIINVTVYPLNDTYDLIFKDMDIANFKIFDGCKKLKIDWNENLNYAVKMYGDGNQEDFYVALLVNAGHFNPQQEKSTTFQWIDAEPCIGPMGCDDIGDEETCVYCNCDWDFEFRRCFMNSGDCSDFDDEQDCNDCGCEWIGGPENFYVNVNDIWRLTTGVYVNVGDIWRDVELVKVNVGDVWRVIFSI